MIKTGLAPFTQFFKHKVRGSTYKIIGTAMLQINDPLTDYDEMVVYQAKDGTLWVRSKFEFDYKFKKVRKGW